MKKFILKTILFSVILLTLFSSILVFYCIRYIKVEKKQIDIASTYNTIIMGDSEMKRLSPIYFEGSAYNYSTIAEHYYFTFLKLQKLLSFENSKVDIVLLGVSVHNFSPLFQRYFDVNLPEGQSSFNRYMFYIDSIDNKFLKPGHYPNLKNIVYAVFGNQTFGWGYNHSTSKNPENIVVETVLKHHYNHDWNKDDLSQEYYLEQIVNLCNSKNIRLVFISTPVHQLYRENVENKYFDILANVINKYPHIEYQNYLKVNIDSKYMADGNHLNGDGGKIFAIQINAKLKEQTHNQRDTSTIKNR